MNKSLYYFFKNVIILILFFSCVFFVYQKINQRESNISNNGEYTIYNLQQRLNNDLQKEYDNYIQSDEVKKLIVKYLKSNYGIKTNINKLFYNNENHTYLYTDEKYSLRFTFRSELQDLTGSIAAYVMATDAVLAGKTISLEDLSISISYQHIVKEVKKHQVLKVDTNIKHFDSVVSEGYKDQLSIIDSDESDGLLYSENNNEGFIRGTIEIPLYYDLSEYRKEELQNYYETDELKNRYQLIEQLSLRQRELYWSYFDITGNKDYRGYIFYPLRNLGLIMYTPISGLNSNFSYGVCSESEDIGLLEQLQNKTINEIWAEISSLDKQGVCSTRSYIGQCTSFANYWFYLQYGYDPLMGNGNHMAAALVRDLPELFEDGCAPAAGGLVSIGSANKANHVICVDAVDYENDKVIISEANTYGYANIRLRVEYTFEEFENYCLKICKSMCNGNTDGFYINYANPIKK